MKKILFILLLIGGKAFSQCNPVTNLATTSTSINSASFSWTGAANSQAYSWAVFTYPGLVYVTAGSTPNTFMTVAGLSASTQYRLRIRNICNNSSVSVLDSLLFTTNTQTAVYTPMTAAAYQIKYAKFDSGLHIPFRTPTLGRGTTRPGALVVNPADSLVYYWNGATWGPLATDSAGIMATLNQKVDSVTLASDTLYYWINGTSYGTVFTAVLTSRNINTTSPILGGGNLSADRTISLAGLTGLGTANQILGMNNAATAYEYKTVSTSSTAVSNDVGVTLSGANALVINLPTASATVRGVTSTADWSTFNGKQAAGSYITALTGDGTASGPGSSVLTLAAVNSNIGSFTNASITVNAKGLITAASSGSAPESPLTFNNGLTRTSNTVTLGGALNANTTITGATFDFKVGTSGSKVRDFSFIGSRAAAMQILSGGDNNYIDISAKALTINGSNAYGSSFMTLDSSVAQISGKDVATMYVNNAVAQTSVSVGSTAINLEAVSLLGGSLTSLSVDTTTIILHPSAGDVKVLNLTTGASTDSVLVWNATTNRVHRRNASAFSGGGITLAAIGSTPNANAATLTGSVLNLEPASASFGGVVNTTTQDFEGDKTMVSGIFNVSKSQNGTTYVYTSNGTSGTAAMARYALGNNAGALYTMEMLSSGYTTSGIRVLNKGVLKVSGLAAGLNIGTDGAHPIEFWTNGSARVSISSAGAFTPVTNDGAALGTTALQFSDLFLAEGGVINWDNGDATLTQTGNEVRLEGANLGIGVAPTNYKLDITSATNGADLIRLVNSSSGTGAQATYYVENNLAQTATYGLTGSGYSAFGAIAASNAFLYSAQSMALMSNGGDIKFASGGSAERMRVSSVGNFLIAGTTDPASAVGAIVMSNGTAPTGNVANTISLYTTGGELTVRDAGGSTTTLSPHNFSRIPEGKSEELAWTYNSFKDEKYIAVDMAKAMRTIEKQSEEIEELKRMVYELSGVIYEKKKAVKLVYTGKIEDK